MRCSVSKKQAMKMWLVPLVRTKETKKTDCCSGNKMYTHEVKCVSILNMWLLLDWGACWCTLDPCELFLSEVPFCVKVRKRVGELSLVQS